MLAVASKTTVPPARANTAECVLEAVNDGSTQFLFQPPVGAGNPPEPFRSGLVPSHPIVSGRKTFQLEAHLSGQSTETCSFDHIKFYGFALS
jgi:hypothetical protein